MYYNSTSYYWNFNRSFSSSGEYTWNVTCDSDYPATYLEEENNISLRYHVYYSNFNGSTTNFNSQPDIENVSMKCWSMNSAPLFGPDLETA